MNIDPQALIQKQAELLGTQITEVMKRDLAIQVLQRQLQQAQMRLAEYEGTPEPGEPEPGPSS